jgi:hypothetical protein
MRIWRLLNPVREGNYSVLREYQDLLHEMSMEVWRRTGRRP